MRIASVVRDWAQCLVCPGEGEEKMAFILSSPYVLHSRSPSPAGPRRNRSILTFGRTSHISISTSQDHSCITQVFGDRCGIQQPALAASGASVQVCNVWQENRGQYIQFLVTQARVLANVRKWALYGERGVKKRGRSSLCSFPNDAVPAFPPLCTSLPKLPVDDLTLSPYLSPTPRRPIRSLHAHTPRQILLHHHKHRRGVHRISPPSSNLLPRLPTFLAAIRES